MRMQLHARHLASGERGRDIPRSRVLLAALRKTFHPLIVSIFGVYAAFSTAALCYILWVVYHVDYRSVLDVPSAFQSGYTPTLTNSTSPVDLQSYVMWLESATDTRETLLTMLWLNIVINYAAGVVTAMSYWAWRMLGGLWRISRSVERRGAVKL